MYAIRKCQPGHETDEALAIFRRALPDLSCAGDKDSTFFLARIGGKAVAAICLKVSEGRAEVSPVAFVEGPATDGIGMALRRRARDEAIVRGFKQLLLPDGKTESLPAAHVYMCKVCGRENRYVPRPGARLKCAGCGYLTLSDELTDRL